MRSKHARLGLGLVCSLALTGYADQHKSTLTPTRKRVGIVKPQALVGYPSDSADATLIVAKTSQGYHFAHVESQGIEYNASGCRSYIVDVVIPAGYRAPYDWIKLYAGPANFNQMNQSESACKGSLTWTVWKRLPRPATLSYKHSAVANEEKNSTWIFNADGSYCDSGLSWKLRLPTAEGNASQATVFRIVAVAKSSGQVAPVRVGWHWEYGG